MRRNTGASGSANFRSSDAMRRGPFSVYDVAIMTTLSQALSDLQLPDPDGNDFRLGDFWQETPAVVVFLRHYG